MVYSNHQTTDQLTQPRSWRRTSPVGVIERDSVILSEVRRFIWDLPMLDSERHTLEALWVYGYETQTCFAASAKIRAKAGSFRHRNATKQGQEAAKDAPISRSGYYAALKSLESAGLIAERQQCGPGKAAAYYLVDPRSLDIQQDATQAARTRRLTAKKATLTAKRDAQNWTASGLLLGQQSDRTYIESKNSKDAKETRSDLPSGSSDLTRSGCDADQASFSRMNEPIRKSFDSKEKSSFNRHREDRKNMLRSRRKTGPPRP